jgi:uncharacterized protein YdcH (DUF465 family)
MTDIVKRLRNTPFRHKGLHDDEAAHEIERLRAENTVKPGFEIEPIEVTPEPLHDPMDAHWQALIAERDKLKEEIRERDDVILPKYRAERDKLKEERDAIKEEFQRDMAHATDIIKGYHNNMFALIERVSKLEQALEKIKFRNHPGTTNHELAKEALSRTSEEA